MNRIGRENRGAKPFLLTNLPSRSSRNGAVLRRAEVLWTMTSPFEKRKIRERATDIDTNAKPHYKLPHPLSVIFAASGRAYPAAAPRWLQHPPPDILFEAARQHTPYFSRAAPRLTYSSSNFLTASGSRKMAAKSARRHADNNRRPRRHCAWA